jgi:hypothetical protein
MFVAAHVFLPQVEFPLAMTLPPNLMPMDGIEGTQSVFLVFFGHRRKMINFSSSSFVYSNASKYFVTKVKASPNKLFPTFPTFFWMTIIFLCSHTLNHSTQLTMTLLMAFIANSKVLEA